MTESRMVWVRRDLKVHLRGRDTFHQTRAAPSPIQHSRDGAAPAHQDKLLQRKGGKKDKAEKERRAATRDAVPSAGSGANTTVQDQEPGGAVTVPRILELLRLEKLSEGMKH